MCTDGTCRIEYRLEVENESQVPMLIGTKGRNVRYLKERAEFELAKKYQKRTTVNIFVVKGKQGIGMFNENPENIVHPDFGMKKSREAIEGLKSGDLPLEEVMKRLT